MFSPDLFQKLSKDPKSQHIFGSELFKNISSDPQSMKQAEHIWKMLDDMSESNPEQYKKFVQQNIQDGAKELLKNKKEEKQDEKIESKQTKVNIGDEIEKNILQGIFGKNGMKTEEKQQQELDLQQKAQIQKKPLIEEIGKDQQRLEEPQYSIKQVGQELEVSINLPNTDNFREIDLELSNWEIRIKSVNKYDFIVKLNQKIDNNNPIAKWNKKAKKLFLQVKLL